jgi:hypothetical protein
VEIIEDVGGKSELEAEGAKLSSLEIVKRQLNKFSTHRLKPLFQTKRLGFTTVLIWFCWGMFLLAARLEG